MLREVLSSARQGCEGRDQEAAAALYLLLAEESALMQEVIRPALDAAKQAFERVPGITVAMLEDKNGALRLAVKDGPYSGRIAFQPLRACSGSGGIRYDVETSFRQKSHWLGLQRPVHCRTKALTLIRKFVYWLYEADEPAHLAKSRDNEVEKAVFANLELKRQKPGEPAV